MMRGVCSAPPESHRAQSGPAPAPTRRNLTRRDYISYEDQRSTLRCFLHLSNDGDGGVVGGWGEWRDSCERFTLAHECHRLRRSNVLTKMDLVELKLVHIRLEVLRSAREVALLRVLVLRHLPR